MCDLKYQRELKWACKNQNPAMLRVKVNVACVLVV